MPFELLAECGVVTESGRAAGFLAIYERQWCDDTSDMGVNEPFADV